MRSALLSLSLLILSTPVAAQTPPAPAAEAQPVEPELLAKARPIAAIILADGTMEKMMGPMMQKMMGPMMDGMTKAPIREIMKVGGLDAEKADTLGKATVEEVMAILDPNFRKRMDVIMNTMMPAMGRFMGRYEPEMREGMAEAFAYRYDAAELDQIAAFLKTPTGGKFGAGFMELATDPHYLDRVMKIMPDMMRAMPEIMKPAIDEIAKLPKPRTYDDLSKAERDHLIALLGSDAKKAN